MSRSLAKRFAVLAATAALLPLGQCSRKKERDKTVESTPLRPHVRTAASDLSVVARIDLDRFRKSALWARLSAWPGLQKLRTHVVAKTLTEKCRFDPFNDLTRISLSIPFGLAEPEPRAKQRTFAAIAEGPFKSVEMMKCLEELLTAQNVKFGRSSFNGKPALLLDPPKGPGILITPLGERELGVATTNVRERLAGRRSVFAEASQTSAGRALDRRAMVWVVFTELPALVARSFSRTPLLGPISLKAAAATADVTDPGFRVKLAFHVASQKQADTAAKRGTAMRDTLEQIKHKAPPRTSLLYAVIRKAAFEAKGPVLIVDLVLSREQAVKILIAPFERYLEKARATKTRTGN